MFSKKNRFNTYFFSLNKQKITFDEGLNIFHIYFYCCPVK